uniref:Uncharacterized protein n=1 Tax=Bursaphelenchus xylophilus TaxID=6326 RepID=A0A1I7SIK3_BURXY
MVMTSSGLSLFSAEASAVLGGTDEGITSAHNTRIPQRSASTGRRDSIDRPEKTPSNIEIDVNPEGGTREQNGGPSQFRKYKKMIQLEISSSLRPRRQSSPNICCRQTVKPFATQNYEQTSLGSLGASCSNCGALLQIWQRFRF